MQRCHRSHIQCALANSSPHDLSDPATQAGLQERSELEDIVHWTTGVDEVLDGEEVEIDRVLVDTNLVAAIEALEFAMEDGYSVYKLDLTSEAHSERRQSVKKNWLGTSNLAMETALLAAFEPCVALPHMQEFDAVKKNNAAGGFITDEQADKFCVLSSLQLIVHAFGMVGGKTCLRLPPTVPCG